MTVAVKVGTIPRYAKITKRFIDCMVLSMGMSPPKVSKHDLIYLKMVPSEWFQVMMLASTLASSEEALFKPCCSLY